MQVQELTKEMAQRFKLGVQRGVIVTDVTENSLAAQQGIEREDVITEVDGKPVCVVVPSDREVSMKKLAAAFAGKAANMMRPADAERLTGYHVGGISPFAQKKRVPVAIEAAALGERSVYLNGGQRGLQIELDPKDVVRALDAIVAALTA